MVIDLSERCGLLFREFIKLVVHDTSSADHLYGGKEGSLCAKNGSLSAPALFGAPVAPDRRHRMICRDSDSTLHFQPHSRAISHLMMMTLLTMQHTTNFIWFPSGQNESPTSYSYRAQSSRLRSMSSKSPLSFVCEPLVMVWIFLVFAVHLKATLSGAFYTLAIAIARSL